MNHEEIKAQKEKEQEEYKSHIDLERDLPNSNILPAPDERFINPIDIKDYK